MYFKNANNSNARRFVGRTRNDSCRRSVADCQRIAVPCHDKAVSDGRFVKKRPGPPNSRPCSFLPHESAHPYTLADIASFATCPSYSGYSNNQNTAQNSTERGGFGDDRQWPGAARRAPFGATLGATLCSAGLRVAQRVEVWMWFMSDWPSVSNRRSLAAPPGAWSVMNGRSVKCHRSKVGILVRRRTFPTP
jgi:hypothetical protein